ncbi:helix-turn-helix domain-containing protein [Paraburkholderia sp. 40]|uniref:helix-turn-helix domain-containing protein n=1 Tax=Paraburkholderia sp. 40 TaxID=2991059 RepID=UPI003D23B0F1
MKLVKAEEITLQEMAINHRFKNTRRRATGLLMLARGDKPKVVCEALGVSDQAVYNWAHAWRIGGVCALMTAGDVAEVMRKQATGSNIHCGTSSKRAVSNGSSAQRKTVSAFFLSTVLKIHTVRPHHGCQR